MTGHSISSISFRAILTGLLLCLLPILPARAGPDTPAATQAAGSISGRITDVVTGLPIAGVTVEVVNTSTPVATTDADGRYQLINVPEGQRYLLFEHPRYASEYYPDAPVMMLATALTVKAGEQITGIDASLAPGGRISGRVTDKDTGAPLGGVHATARYQWYSEWRVAGEGVTGEDGRYAIEGLWTSVYHLEFVDQQGDHATTQYGDGAGVGLLTGEEVTDVDIALPHEGRIAGQVTDALTGSPLPGVAVRIYDLTTWDEFELPSGETNESGHYDIGGLPANLYWVGFTRDGYAPIFYGGKSVAWESTPVEVHSEETNGGINQALAPLGGITGRVTDAITGAPLVAIDVYLDNADYSPMPAVRTAADGAYAFTGILPGEHTVFLRDPKGVYQNGQAKGPEGSSTITVQPGRTTAGVDAALLPWTVSKRKITGSVTDAATGQPLSGINASLLDCYHLGPSPWCHSIGLTITDSAGNYAFYDPSSSAEALNFLDPSGIYVAQDATDFRLPGLDEAVVIDMALRRYDQVYGGISGKVATAATGEPLSGEWVCAGSVGAAEEGCAHTSVDGTYTISGLSAGQYTVKFGARNTWGDRYGRQTYAEPVTVKANEVTANIDGALPEQGRIAGTIRSRATGEPLPNTRVEFCTANAQGVVGCNPVYSAAAGAYVSMYLPPDVYRVRAIPGAYEARYYPSALEWHQAVPIPVTYGSLITGIDISVPDLGSLTGRVTDAQTGAPVAGITVTAENLKYLFYFHNGTTGEDGRYTIPYLHEGGHRLRFEDPQERYALLESSETVTVTLGVTTTFDVQVTSYGYITGKVTAAESGAPLGGIEVRTGNFTRRTDPDGTYKIGPLPDGEYEVRYWDPALLRRMENSPKVTVKAGETAAGIDRAMDRLAIARGRVIDADTGAPVAGVKVSGRGAYSANVPVYTDAEGRYELPGLDEGAYTLAVQDRSRAYLDGQSEKMAFPVGSILDVPDMRLKRWGEFGGTVTDAMTGEPVPGVWVQLYEHSSGEWYTTIGGCYAITGPDGTYRIRGMYDWTVRPVFYDPQQRYHAQSYGGGKSLLDAQVVMFKRGADLLGVDAALMRREDGPPVELRQRLYLPVVAAP